MRFIWLSILLATWLLVSAFALPQTALSSAVAFLAAIAVVALALAAGGKPSLHWGITVLSLALAFLALLLPDVSWVARLSTTLVAAVLFVLSWVRPRHEHTDEELPEVTLPRL